MRRRRWRRSAARTRFGRSITASFAASIAAACRSLPRRIVGAAASFFVCSARESMIEVVRASSSARSRKSSSNLQRWRRDQRAAASAFQRRWLHRARLVVAACGTAPAACFASELNYHRCSASPNRHSSRRVKYFCGLRRLRRVRRHGSEQR